MSTKSTTRAAVERPAILVAPDKFKQTFRAREVAAAVGRGLESGGWEIDLCPVADGGDGTMPLRPRERR
ncbi:MAG: glycerate kinase [Solirubrobacterales bacterium]|nr:glycerate kinase [Solirubrobacterales bacterium]